MTLLFTIWTLNTATWDWSMSHVPIWSANAYETCVAHVQTMNLSRKPTDPRWYVCAPYTWKPPQ